MVCCSTEGETQALLLEEKKETEELQLAYFLFWTEWPSGSQRMLAEFWFCIPSQSAILFLKGF